MRALAIGCFTSVSGVVVFELVARVVSFLVCHRRFSGEDNSWGMVNWLRLVEYLL